MNEDINEALTVESPGATKHYYVWDRTVRIFHWLNVLCVTLLVGIGTVILNSKSLDINNDGKILLKTIHVYTGYIFALNLSWRLIWGFIGGHYARWRSLQPFSKDKLTSLRSYVHGLKNNNAADYLGHNPLARLMVVLLLLLLTCQAVTGLMLAGTDLYMPPFGHAISKYVAEDKDKLVDVKPYSKENINSDRYDKMREFRKPFITLHYYTFYILLVSILLHIIAVVVAELREKSGLVSAMISGWKVFHNKPVDYKED